MEPNKIEQQIKNKLEGRTIQPSVKSWDRLDAMLSVEEKSKKKSFVWFYVAASLFFVLGMTYWFTSQNSNEVIPQNTIVTTEGEDSSESKEKENTIENKAEINELIEEIKQKYNSIVVQNEVVKEPKTQIDNKEIISNNEVVASNQDKEIQQIETDKSVYVSPEMLLASVENNQENSSITNSNKTKNTVKVDANSLLSSVENEITEEYRETTFDKLKRKFNQAKTAVANRNYE